MKRSGTVAPEPGFSMSGENFPNAETETSPPRVEGARGGARTTRSEVLRGVIACAQMVIHRDTMSGRDFIFIRRETLINTATNYARFQTNCFFQTSTYSLTLED